MSFPVLRLSLRPGSIEEPNMTEKSSDLGAGWSAKNLDDVDREAAY
jgi:hypothetical protein